MSHPILGKLRNLYLYLAIWSLIAILHALLLVMNQHALGEHRFGRWLFIDSLVFNTIFAGLGISFWYPCKFVTFDKGNLTKAILNHVFAAIFVSIIWIGLSYFVMVHILATGENYQGFLLRSLPWRSLTGILYYFVVAAFYYVYIYSENMTEQLTKEAELKALLQEAELKSLKFQINPHFIFNSLNSINSLTMSNPQRAGEMTVKLANYLRYTLSKNEKQCTKLREELESVRLYLEIEKVRFGDKIEFVENVQDGCLDAAVPSMILQPLFENAIRYGVYESLEKVGIRLSCEPYGDYLKVTVENDFDPEAVTKKGEGIGLQNIRNRLEMLYNQKGLLDVQKKSDVFKVNMLIPVS